MIRQHTLGVMVAECTLAHIRKLNRALGAGVHEPVAALWMELGSRYDLGELLHIGRLDVDNVKALLLYVKIPEVDAQVIAADKCLAVTIHGNTVDVVCVSIGVGAARNSRDDCVVVCQAWELQIAGMPELSGR